MLSIPSNYNNTNYSSLCYHLCPSHEPRTAPAEAASACAPALLPMAMPRGVLVPLAALAAVPRGRALAALQRGFVLG